MTDTSTADAVDLDAFETVVGIEVHVQLLTESKAFAPDSAAFGGAPNTHVDPVTLGHPGTLPVLNAAVPRLAAALGLATHCTIRERSVFARKHYLYPDLPKGYQISQFDRPICEGGWIDVETDDGGTRRVGITRIHMEEDAGKLVHGADATRVDHNRCGVPLVEIVFEPDLRSAGEAARALVQIRQIVRYLSVGDGNMEEGSLRCDANVSVRPIGQEMLGTKAEVKNLNSFRNVERAIAYEAERQAGVLRKGGRVVQETRLWDADRQETRSMRSKEQAHDYRYLPDPDLAVVHVSEETLDEIRAAMPQLPADRRARYTDALGLPAADAAVLTDDRATADLFEAVLASLSGDKPTSDEARAVANLVRADVLRTVAERGVSADAFPIDAARLAGLVRLRLDGKISSSAGAEVFTAMLDSSDGPDAVAESRGLFQISDTGALAPLADAVLDEFAAQADQYRGGKTGVLGFLVGQVMKRCGGAADPTLVRQLLVERLG